MAEQSKTNKANFLFFTLSAILWAMWVVFPPGEAHMSRILSPGCGSRTCVHKMEGRFWAKIKSGRRSLTQGASYRGSVIKIPTPLEKISIKLANRNLFWLVKKSWWFLHQTKNLLWHHMYHYNAKKPYTFLHLKRLRWMFAFMKCYEN